jgi:hypothetical protein
MGPEALFLFVVLIVAVVTGGGVYAIRGWLRFRADRDTSAAEADKAQRPVHTVVDNETADRLMTRGRAASRDIDERSA